MPDSFQRPSQRSRFFGSEAYGQEAFGHEGSGFPADPERPSMSDWAAALTWSGDETRLVTELQAGSETAFDWLVTHYHAPVYNLILSMLGDVADASDGTQEVFLKAFRGIRSFRRGSSLKTWLYRIAIREALNHKRWFKRHLQKNVSIDAEPEEGHAVIEIEDLAQTPFDQFAACEIQAAVQSALQQIPDVFRSAVILRDLEGLTYEEVAEVLECSVGTVKSRILRGRRALKDLLEPLLNERPAMNRVERTNVIEMPAPSYGANPVTSSPFTAGLQRRAADFSDSYNFLRKNFSREELP
jgi:RNA polymerase sigma-70 factor (ECF subfamily)